MGLLKAFKENIDGQHLFHPKDTLLLAVSGGVDSVVLCALCKLAGYSFAIAHCNFQLRGEDSKRDEAFVRQMASNYKVDFFCKTFDTLAESRKQKKSIEETARNLRYEWFNELLHSLTGSQELKTKNEALKSYSFLLTAHHADDNIETVLMNFFRGTGLAGLHGILPRQQRIIRPLLFAFKTELEAFAAENKLDFVFDRTNDQNDFTRNYFRNEILPKVKKVFPEAAGNIIKNIARLSEAGELYNQAIALHKKRLLEPKGNEIHIPVLKLKQSQPLSSIVYEIIKEYGFTGNQTGEVISLFESESGKYIQSATHRIIKNRKWLIISPNQTQKASTIIIEGEGDTLFDEGKLELKKIIHYPLSITNYPDIAQLDLGKINFPLLLRKWKKGDYFYPLGMKKKKKISRFLIDIKLSLTQKEKVWVIEQDKKIIWVVGLRIDDRFKILEKTSEALQMHFTAI